jgi:hypothetical protein
MKERKGRKEGKEGRKGAEGKKNGERTGKEGTHAGLLLPPLESWQENTPVVHPIFLGTYACSFLF